MQDDQQQTFREESGELLAELEAALLDLEGRPDDADLVGRVFRALHTLKGLCAMFGQSDASYFVHRVESVFQHVRSGEMQASGEFVTACLEAADLIRTMVVPESDPAVSVQPAEDLLRRLQELKPHDSADDANEIPAVLDEFMPRLTEHELSRVRACIRKGWQFHTLDVRVTLERMERELTSLTDRLKGFGEPISIQPVPGQALASTMQFRLLVASDRPVAMLEELLTALPRETPATPADKPAPDSAERPQLRTYRIRYRPAPDIFSHCDLLPLFEELSTLGRCRTVALTNAIPPLDALDPAICHLSWDIVLATAAEAEKILAGFPAGEGNHLHMEEIGDGTDQPKRLGEILVERGDLRREDLERSLSRQKRVGEMLVEDGVVTPDKVRSALAEQEALREQGKEAAASIRVAVGKLDHLVNLVGELVTAQARLTRMAAGSDLPGLSSLSEEIERLSADLRVTALEIRMIPIGTTFGRFQRLVRDLSRELGKEAELATTGADTELDKTVIERLGDPLVHLVRNCLDHGIEPPDLREASGKPRRGTVHLAAHHTGDAVEITVSDDGAGLDPDRIMSRAAELGLVPAGAVLSNREALALVFTPGFTTSRSVTTVSGRGVGMDVVKRSVDALRGSIELRSEQGTGTTVTIRLPLTLAIVESLLVQVSDSRFVVPLDIVEECIEITDAAAGTGNRVAEVRDRLVPYIPLRDRFEIGGAAPDLQQVVITRVNGDSIGILVDQVIGEHQAVIKPLGRIFRSVPGVSGATVLGDGDLALILDMATLVQGENAAPALH